MSCPKILICQPTLTLMEGMQWIRRPSILVFYRPFLSTFRGPLSRDIPSLLALYSIHGIFLWLSYIRHIFYTFHLYLWSLHIYIARAEYFPLDFGFYFLKASLEQFYIFWLHYTTSTDKTLWQISLFWDGLARTNPTKCLCNYNNDNNRWLLVNT